MTEPKRKPGRTATGRDPARQLGRVDAETWAELQAAASRSGQSFTQWALGHLVRAAKKQK
jgi:uncharacterized protein (DUF1778 family)